jgi:hypothetical protein
MKAVQTLPANYQKAGTFDVKNNLLLHLGLNLAGLVLLAVLGWVFFRVVLALRAGSGASAGGFSLSTENPLGLAGLLVAVLLLTAVQVTLHEAIHGIFFWVYTRSRPKFALRPTYAYAAAPDWFLPRGQALVTCLAPLALLTLAGLAAVPFLPPGWLLPAWYMLTMNAAGSIGDLLVALWILCHSPTTLVQDRGDAVTIFVEAK